MWVTKLNLLKSNPQNSPNKGDGDELSAAAAASNPTSSNSNSKAAAELEAVTNKNGDSGDPNTWQKPTGCCGSVKQSKK